LPERSTRLAASTISSVKAGQEGNGVSRSFSIKRDPRDGY
jgi:hypothetical protein